MRVLVGLMLFAACFRPHAAPGSPCADNGACPNGLVCSPASQTCELVAIDAAMPLDPDAGLTTPNLLYWYRLDESSGTAAHDSSGHDNDGLLRNTGHATWLPNGGKRAGALHVDGTAYQSCVAVPKTCITDPDLSHSVTVASWVNFDAFHTAPYTLGDFAAAQGTSGGTSGGWGLGATDHCGTETIGFEIGTPPAGTARAVRCGGTVLSTGVWYFAVGVYDGATLTLDVYLDGVNDNGTLTGTIPAAGFQPPACPQLGCPSNQFNVMTGALDEFRIYDRALSPAEISALYLKSGG